VKKLAIALLVALAAAPASAARLRLIVRNRLDVDQVDAPVSAGIPWRRGALHSPKELRLLDQEAKERPLQVEVIARWPDRSPKWTLLDFQASVPATGSATYVLEYGPGVHRRAKPARALLVKEDEKVITISSGVATFKVPKARFNVLDYVLLDGQDAPLVDAPDNTDGLRLVTTEEVVKFGSPGRSPYVQLPATDRLFLGRHKHGASWFRRRGFRVLDDATGKELGIRVVGASLDPAGRQNIAGHGWCEGVVLQLSRAPRRFIKVTYPRAAARPQTFYSSLGPARVEVETRGPVRSVVRASGRFQARDVSTLCDYVARLHFYAGKAAARLQLTVRNREKSPRSQGLETYPLLLNDLSLSLALRLRGLNRFVFTGDRRLGATHKGDLVGRDDHAALVQFSSRTSRLARYVVSHGGDAIASGALAGGAVGLRDATQGAIVAVRRLWANNPAALRVLGSSRLEVGIFPREAGPCEEFFAGRAKSHDLLLLFHADEPPSQLDVCAAFDAPLTACAAPDNDQPYTGQWYANSGAVPLAPLGTSDYDLLFGRDFDSFLAQRETTGAYGMWNYGAEGTRRCRIVDLVVDHADFATLHATGLVGFEGAEGRALYIATGRAASLGRTDPLIVINSDPKQGSISFVKAIDPRPEKGTRAALYDLHGEFLCHRFDPAYAIAREHLRRGDPRLLGAAQAASLHLADIGTFHGIQGGSNEWIGACHDPTLGGTAHHVPGLSQEASWYAGAWLSFLLTGDRAILSAALENAAFAARHADDPDTSPLAAALATINLCYAADVAAALSAKDAPVFQAALETYVEKLLEAQRRTPHGLYGEHAATAGLVFEALAAYEGRRADKRVLPSILRAAEALIRPDRFWSGHNLRGRLRRADGSLVKPYATGDGLVADRARNPEAAILGPVCALVHPHLAIISEITRDTRFIKKARRLERVSTLFSIGSARDFALRYRHGDLFAVSWRRYTKAHPSPPDPAIAFQCRLENAADVAMPDIGAGGSVLYRPFVALPDGSRAYQAQAPGIPDRPGAGLWFPLAGSGNIAQKEGAIEFRICYRKGPGRRENPWLLSGDPRKHGFALALKGDGLELVSRYLDRLPMRLVGRGVRIRRGKWNHVAFRWRPVWGTDLFFNDRNVGHSRIDRIGFSRRLRIPCDPDDQTNEYLIDDLRIWKRAPKHFDAAIDTEPPAPVADLRLAPAADGKMLLTWTAPGDDGKEGRARRYDIRTSTQRLGPISWGGYADSVDPIAAIHWAEADRIVPVPKPRAAGRLERLLIGPLPRRRVYIALKTQDEANVSPLSNVVTNLVNHPPIADPGPPLRQAITGSTVIFDARGSSDPDYDDLTYAWSNGIQGPTGTLHYDKPGDHKITLTVSDGQAKASATTRLVVGDLIRVNFQPPGASKPPDGFLADTGAPYTQTRGYGWRALPPRTTTFARDKPAALPLEGRTGIDLPRGGEWLLDVPKGAYELTLAVGDPAHLAGNPRIFAEGKEVLNTELTGRETPFVVTDCAVEIKDGQLNLHVGPPPLAGRITVEGGELNYIIIQRAK